MNSNKVFIATSLDGYIADADGGIEFLDTIPEINTIDTGFHTFIAGVDALLMGRKTYEKVLSFGIEWPYSIPVYVWSKSRNEAPPSLEGKVFFISGNVQEVLRQTHADGHDKLYIDGGSVIQSFLKEDKIDEMIITIIPVLLGDGIPLFGKIDQSLNFECVESKVFLDKVVQNRFVRSKK